VEGHKELKDGADQLRIDQEQQGGMWIYNVYRRQPGADPGLLIRQAGLDLTLSGWGLEPTCRCTTLAIGGSGVRTAEF
jgi:hypothetical protein